MPDLFRRRYELTVGTTKVTDSDISFTVTSSTKSEPNRIDARVFNLNETTRGRLSGLEAVTVKLDVGYETGAQGSSGILSTIFFGDISDLYTLRSGPDFITVFEGGDGRNAIARARINRRFNSGTSIRRVIEQTAQNIIPAFTAAAQSGLSDPSFEGLSGVFQSGLGVSGSAYRNVVTIAESAGLEASFQNGRLLFVQRGQALAGEALLLSSSTGLVESPSSSSDDVVRARTLIIPDLFPYRKVRFDALNVRGFYRVERCSWTGSTDGNEWFCDIECKPIVSAQPVESRSAESA